MIYKDKLEINKLDENTLIINKKLPSFSQNWPFIPWTPIINSEKIKLEIKENNLSWEEVSLDYDEWDFKGYNYLLKNKINWKNEIIFKINR